VELMVSLTVSTFLLIGATTIYMQGRTTFQVAETLARIQEDALFVLDVMEPEIRMTNYFGMRARPDRIEGTATADDPVPMGLDVADDCGVNWSIDLEDEVSGTNNDYDWVGCPAFGDGAQPNSDTLVIRRTAEDSTAVPVTGTMYVQSARFRDGEIFVGPTVPTEFTGTGSASYQLITQGFYVSQSSDNNNALPSLRSKTLVGSAAGPVVVDQEILSGVEDMQVQFGVDTDAIGAANRGSINRYVNPDDPIIDPDDPAFIADAQILAVRIWFRIRAERAENGFSDDANYVYADQDVGPFNDGFRRILISKTVFLRNSRRII